MHRWKAVLGLLALVVGTTAGAGWHTAPAQALPAGAPSSVASVSAAGDVNPLEWRVRGELRVFTDWLQANGARGFIGEVGWPNDRDAAEWNALASRWYADAAAANLPVTSWATGEFWGQGYKLSAYTASNWEWTGVDTHRSQASVIEQQPAAQRGINVAGAEFAFPDIASTSKYSNVNPGTYGTEWFYPTKATFDYLASRGITTVRLPIRWERIQPQLGGPLDNQERRRLTDAIALAGNAGLDVVIDVHNYAAYYLHDGRQGVRRAIGSAQVTTAHFADLWRRLSLEYGSTRAVSAYGLMNEPVGMSGGAPAWETASQAALDAVRANGDRTLVLVPGYEWSGVQRWSTIHPKAWITDSANNHRYDAHHYFDRDNSSRYLHSYAAEVTHAATLNPENPDRRKAERVAGTNRTATAVQVSARNWDRADTVLLATGSNFPDALAAAALAAQRNAPLLLTSPTSVPGDVRDEIVRLGADEVVIIGGPAVVSETVAQQVRQLPTRPRVSRIAGANRFETAARVATAAGAPATSAVVASGTTFADAVASGALAAIPQRLPVLLAAQDQVPAATTTALRDLQLSRVAIAGGESAIGANAQRDLGDTVGRVDRLAGSTRYQTSQRIAEEALDHLSDDARPLIVASGANYPDALAAGALAARVHGVLLLVPPTSLPAHLQQFASTNQDRFSAILVVGGPSAVSDGVAAQLEAAVYAGR